ncbi:hypothetical protein SAMN04488094_10491 [Tropicimonas isoalkanivorans]|uniref:CTP synthetase n=2 Tax=Tropicimonas isoalkanivorans TaxID=441112 RepID=A0A1I1IH37_9RHOB|nr:hypothetical protein SAMN04488094_10491 [Tropicimonas isoalkanivorans]
MHSDDSFLIRIKVPRTPAGYPAADGSDWMTTMLRLTLLIHALASTVIMGVGIVAVLVMGFVSAKAIIAAIVIGLILGVPVAWLIAQKLHEG